MNLEQRIDRARRLLAGVEKNHSPAALAGRLAWVTGLRREQSDSRTELAEAAMDPAHRIWKFNPLADRSEADVWEYLKKHRVPYNALHDRGYPSIGCEPCTRAVKPGE